MDNSISLKMTSKEEDRIPCDICEDGIFVPYNPDSEINHGFYCNKCGQRVNIDGNVVVE